MTEAAELQARVVLGELEPKGIPTEFVRFVYCLGYGEKKLVDGPVKTNWGTPQFWKIFATCADENQKWKKQGERNLQNRIKAKLAILELMRARGVWLLDASPFAVYSPAGSSRESNARGRSRLDDAAVHKLPLITWEEFAAQVIREAAPRAVMFIGKTLNDTLEVRLRQVVGRSTEIAWMYQPQAPQPEPIHADGRARLKSMVMKHGICA
jgi:hypothetical protein